MKTHTSKQIAIVCDWIKDWWGAELVLSHLLEAFPEADIFTSVFYQKNNPIFEGREITPSFIQKIPLLNTSHKLALFFRPQAFEGFDLSKYDIVISSSSAESKGVITKVDCLHICYCHTPTRYFWSHYENYKNMMEFGVLNPLAKLILPRVINSLRKWDYAAAQRPDFFIANSKNTQKRIQKYYDRESSVIYPAIDISEFPFTQEKQEYYLAVGRCIPYKKFDLLVDTFNVNGKKLIIATNTNNRLYKKLKNISKHNIEWKMNLPRKEIIDLYAKARAFVFPPEEDFGLVPVEAQACGTPVIAYWKWGALETVVPALAPNLSQKKRGQIATGIFFEEQTPESLQKAIDLFETMTFDSEAIRKHAEQFDKKIFQKELIEFIQEKPSL